MEKKSKFKSFLTRIGAVRLSQICDKFRKPFNFCWKAGLAILAIVFTINLVEALVDTCKDHLGLTHYYWGDKDTRQKMIQLAQKSDLGKYHIKRRLIPFTMTEKLGNDFIFL